MKKILLPEILRISILALCALFLLSGCATTTVPDKASNMDTLVVLPLLIIDASLESYQEDVSFKLNFENISTGRQYSIDIRNSDSDFAYSKNFPAGEYVVKGYEATGGVNGGKYRTNFNKHIVVQQGAMTLCPYKFSVVTYKNNKKNSIYFYSDITELKAEQYKLIRDRLASHENFSKWAR